jgi:hypothetical protein
MTTGAGMVVVAGAGAGLETGAAGSACGIAHGEFGGADCSGFTVGAGATGWLVTAGN